MLSDPTQLYLDMTLVSHTRRRGEQATVESGGAINDLWKRIAVWNTRSMEAALNHMRTSEYPVQGSELEHLSSITSAHINLHGSYHLDLQASKKRNE